jgi:hypothetical protein
MQIVRVEEGGVWSRRVHLNQAVQEHLNCPLKCQDGFREEGREESFQILLLIKSEPCFPI